MHDCTPLLKRPEVDSAIKVYMVYDVYGPMWNKNVLFLGIKALFKSVTIDTFV